MDPVNEFSSHLQSSVPAGASRKESMAVAGTMSQRLVTAHPAESAQSAFEKMERRGVHHLPVIDESGQLIGLLSSHDLSRAISDEFRAQAQEPAHGRDAANQADLKFRSVVRSIHDLNPRAIVRDLMTMTPVTISPQTEVRAAAQIMIEQKLSALVVLGRDEQGREAVAGLVTHEDLLRVLIHVLDGKSMELSHVEAMLYNSPFGDVVNALSNAGI